MENKNMTALISCFARAYHSKNYKNKILDDYLAEKLLSKEEYENISISMEKGISFFNCNFKGSKEQALRYIVDNQLSPSVLARSILTEDILKKEIDQGLHQYLIFASGYDTSAYRLKENLKVYELDKNKMIDDKIARLDRSNIDRSMVNYIKCDFINDNWIEKLMNSTYSNNEKSFCSLLGISYYLSKEEFKNMIDKISNIISKGSIIVFDYPTIFETENEVLNQKLAKEADEEMKSKYSKEDIKNIVNSNMSVYKIYNYNYINNMYFKEYNKININNNILPPKGVNYCLLVKQ